MLQIIHKLAKNSKGATAIEYGLIVALVSIAAIGAWQALGTKLTSTTTTVANSLQ